MLTLFVVSIVVVYAAEVNGSPAQHLANVAGGNFEGKELRFGLAAIARSSPRSRPSHRAAPSTRPSTRYTGIGGLVPLFNISTGEVIFGGVGSGLFGMLLFVVLAVFIAGLMVGRTPEYLGKKIEAREVKLTMIGTLFVPLAVLVGHRARHRRPSTAPRRSSTPARRASPSRSTPTSRRRTTTAPHSPATPASSSRTRPATSALSASRSPTCWADSPCSSAASSRWLRRSAWRARSRASKPGRSAPAPSGPTRPTFVVLLIFIIVIVAALTFFPAFLLGPVVQGLTDQLF